MSKRTSGTLILPQWCMAGAVGVRPVRLTLPQMGGGAAKLTGMVNIAVFAAFRWCVEGDLLSNPLFKRVCRGCRCRFAAKAARMMAKAARIAARIVARVATPAAMTEPDDERRTRGLLACAHGR